MAEAVADTRKSRKPLIAIVLSLIMPGLGHVYCGRFVRGLVLAFLSGIFICIVMAALSVSNSAAYMAIIAMSLSASLVIDCTFQKNDV